MAQSDRSYVSFARLRDSRWFYFDDVIVLIASQKSGAPFLSGFPLGEKQRRMREFAIPLDGGGIIAESVTDSSVMFASAGDRSNGMFEEQLLRVMRTECLVCMPLYSEQICLGVLVGGLSIEKAEDLWGRERFLKSFSSLAATSIVQSPTARSDIEKYLGSEGK